MIWLAGGDTRIQKPASRKDKVMNRFYRWIHRKTGQEVNCIISTHELMTIWRSVKKHITGLSFLRFG